MEKTQIDLSTYRLEKAKDDLGTAEENLEKNRCQTKFSHKVLTPAAEDLTPHMIQAARSGKQHGKPQQKRTRLD